MHCNAAWFLLCALQSSHWQFLPSREDLQVQICSGKESLLVTTQLRGKSISSSHALFTCTLQNKIFLIDDFDDFSFVISDVTYFASRVLFSQGFWPALLCYLPLEYGLVSAKQISLKSQDKGTWPTKDPVVYIKYSKYQQQSG